MLEIMRNKEKEVFALKEQLDSVGTNKPSDEINTLNQKLTQLLNHITDIIKR